MFLQQLLCSSFLLYSLPTDWKTPIKRTSPPFTIALNNNNFPKIILLCKCYELSSFSLLSFVVLLLIHKHSCFIDIFNVDWYRWTYGLSLLIIVPYWYIKKTLITNVIMLLALHAYKIPIKNVCAKRQKRCNKTWCNITNLYIFSTFS